MPISHPKFRIRYLHLLSIPKPHNFLLLIVHSHLDYISIRNGWYTPGLGTLIQDIYSLCTMGAKGDRGAISGHCRMLFFQAVAFSQSDIEIHCLTVSYLKFDGLSHFLRHGKPGNDLSQLSIFSHVFIYLTCNLELA